MPPTKLLQDPQLPGSCRSSITTTTNTHGQFPPWRFRLARDWPFECAKIPQTYTSSRRCAVLAIKIAAGMFALRRLVRPSCAGYELREDLVLVGPEAAAGWSEEDSAKNEWTSSVWLVTRPSSV
ncbi:hypothetical protein Aduo_012493 [Ancylostoma duodenale]